MPIDDVLNAFCDHGRVDRQTHRDGHQKQLYANFAYP